jgi:hypothetical protein
MESMSSENDERCRCGHTQDSFWVRPERTYGFWGTFLFVIGVTPRPKRVDIKCSHCGHVFERITDSPSLYEYK